MHKKFIIQKPVAGTNISTFLAQHGIFLSLAEGRRACLYGAVLVNNEPVAIDFTLDKVDWNTPVVIQVGRYTYTFQVDKKVSVLFRSTKDTLEEEDVARKYFQVTNSRMDLTDCTVIGRYSVLPYYKELEQDLLLQNSKLINSYFEHLYISTFDYYWDVEEYTPKTWFDIKEVPNKGGPFVLKGQTNSRKFNWNTKMFALDFQRAVAIHNELSCDDLLGPQGIIIRQYEKLKTYEIGLNGLPFTNEWRFFFYKEDLLSFGYYWTMAEEQKWELSNAGLDFAVKIAKIIAQHTNFFVLDIAQKEDGDWILIEVNDGQMSGLSLNQPDTLYSKLSKKFK